MDFDSRRLKSQPLSSPCLKPGASRSFSGEELLAGLHSFPIGNYVVFYREIENGIDVIRVLHGSRDIEDIFSRG
ncbi:type II toxin-antitoxin system RelE/ParE family toxin [Microcoleus sp. T2B6]